MTDRAAVLAPARAALEAIREAVANDGLRRLGLTWAVGIAADAAVLVVLLVEVYARDGAVATGLLGAVRMVPAVISGMLSSSLLARFRGDRILLTIGLVRSTGAFLVAATVLMHGPTILLFVLATVIATAGAPVRPTQVTLMPALARSPGELVAANTAWSTGEGVGALLGPFAAGLLLANGSAAGAAALAGTAFAATALVVAGLRFEDAADASGSEAPSTGPRLLAGLRILRRRPVPGWSMVAVFGQVLTRGALNTLLVAAAVELLDMGDGGVGILTAAIGLGGLFGAVFAMSLTRSDRLIRSMVTALAYWGAPLAVIGLLPTREVALVALAVVGIANATFDVALFTIVQRGTANNERSPVLSVLEGALGLAAVLGSLLAPLLIGAFGVRGALALAGAFLPILAFVIYGQIGRADRLTILDEARMQALRRVPAFAALPLTAIERVGLGAVPRQYAPGDLLMREGDEGDEFLVIEDGEVEILVGGRHVHVLGPGAGVGDVALVRRSPRTATVVARTELRVLVVDRATFLAAVAGPAAAAITERVAAAHLARAAAEA